MFSLSPYERCNQPTKIKKTQKNPKKTKKPESMLKLLKSFR